MNELESRLAALEMGPPQTQTQTGYYAPQMAYGMMPGGQPPPTSVQIPPAYLQQNNGGKRNNNENNHRGQRRRPNNYQGGGRVGGYRGGCWYVGGIWTEVGGGCPPGIMPYAICVA